MNSTNSRLESTAFRRGDSYTKETSVAVAYVWDSSHARGVDANLVGAEIDALGKRLGKPFRGVTPRDVVDSARELDSPLHPLFEWNDDKAAERWRVHQARNVLNSLRVVVVTEDNRCEGPRISRVSVNAGGDVGRLYVPVITASRNEALRVRMLEDALTGLVGWRKRYAELKGVDGAVEHVDKAVAMIKATIRIKLEAVATPPA